MPEYGCFLTRIFPYNDRIEVPVLIRENTGKSNPLFWNNLRSVYFMTQEYLVVLFGTFFRDINPRNLRMHILTKLL